MAEMPNANAKQEDKKEYRVGTFAYTFKTGTSVIKASPEGIYTPTNKEEKDLLDWQVKKQLILYK